jgi:predicted TPR repeat methyltransferase
MDQMAIAVDADTLMARVEQLIEQGRPAAARPLLAAARGLAPPSSGMSMLAARLALSDGRLDAAQTELDRALELAPDHAGLRKCRAEVRRQLGDLEGATRDAAEAVIFSPVDPAAKAMLGDLLFDLGRIDDAIACMHEALCAAPRDVICRERLSQALVAAGDMPGATRVLLDGVVLLPGSSAMRNAAALLSIRRRDFSGAATLTEQARLDGVADATTFGLSGHALSSLGRHDEATLAYQEARKLAPDDSNLRHLAATAGIASGAAGDPDDYLKILFDGYADRFESHLIELGYRIPGLLRRHVMEFAASKSIGPALDLGCGTGMVALALSDLAVGPFTGIDISPRMLDMARDKGLYASLFEARLPDALHNDESRWRLILAADLMCYFGALEDMFDAVRARLTPGGRFIFSVEELLPDHDGAIPGNGEWAPLRLGRYAHAASYVARTADAAGFNCVGLSREVLRHEAGGPVAGLIMVLERPRADA